VPKPQAPFTSNPVTMRVQLRLKDWPLSGATTSQATSVGPRAPKMIEPSQYAAPFDEARKKIANTNPQTPPQKARDQTCGIAKGLVGCMGKGAYVVNPTPWSIDSIA
jgi:hypothetical protein